MKELNNKHLVCFRLDKNHYAIPLDYVDRVLRMVAIAKVPDAPKWMIGVIDLQGQVIPVLDLRKRFNLPEKAIHPDNRMIVLHHKEKLYAITADEVTRVAELSQMTSNHAHGMMDENIPVSNVLRYESHLIMVLDPEKIVGQQSFTA
jgi:purine-binding chemotaxis protein CheW